MKLSACSGKFFKEWATRPAKAVSTIEPLEARIAPATLVNPTTLTFQDKNGDTATVRPTGPLRVNNGDAMMPLLVGGGGLGILPDFIVGEAVDDGALEVVLPDWKVSGGAVHWVAPPGGRRPKRVEVLGGFLAEKLSPRRSKRLDSGHG